ncbi:sodium:calcium antiporter [Desertifilum sp. FACHB-1129]|uniref:sodium:calcium antiporter n=1 Tax=Desertifilum TaxID=1185872 RepID=UPI0009F397BF|nr:sodium:calcium antiporter [Desertifilum tharense]MBD2312643.1 sodium:calcium antiporter [Desertifilum sp. FACHB-1129]MBD2320457.1 sodium:calcium antiporter [Desertifilum sp. FACHB-866]MBD2330585.1 sodium:calcium antiporter [Desertifilum sp. FACHB-868]MDA0210052.1 sodium:calcium antiporter [Cyanobacteria bacterium FC1]
MSEPLLINLGIFVLSAIAIALAGSRLAGVADRLAEVTGLGQALVGAIFLGGCTSLPGIVTSITAAAGGHAELATSNALGAIAAQTVYLAVADIAYSKANLEHAAASVTNLIQATLLVALLAIPLVAMSGPDISVFGIHPATLLIPITYIFGLYLISESQSLPMWRPLQTSNTMQETVPHAELERVGEDSGLRSLAAQFLALAAVVTVAGYGVAHSALGLSQVAHLSEGLVGSLFTAISNSLPELVTTVAAVRRGALTLAVGGVIGGNSFDVLLLALSDVAYREGSIYKVLAGQQIFAIGLTILMTGILILGMLRRERHGIGNIGLESVLLIVLYVGGFIALFFQGWQG